MDGETLAKGHEHHCSCGLSLDRDANAAINILALGLQSVSLRAKEAPSSKKGSNHLTSPDEGVYE